MMWPVLFGLSGALFDRLFDQFDYMEPFPTCGNTPQRAGFGPRNQTRVAR